MKKAARSLFTIVTLVGLALVSCQGPGTKNPPKDDTLALEGVITGILTNSGGAPVVGAQVTLGGTSVTSAALTLEPAAVGLVVTNAAGEFAFDVDEEGEYALTTLLDNEGAYMRVTVVRGSDGELSSAPVSLESAPLGGVVGSIAGRGAGAWAFLLGTSFLASTDSEGAFVISRVPAGTYQLAPGLLGATGAPVAVTVEAGSLTTVDAPLVLGPVITSVEPRGFSPWVMDLDTLTYKPHEVIIRGSGFGDERGISQIQYAGWDLSDYALSWSDDEIVLNTQHSWSSGSIIDFEALRFSFVSATGVARSGVGGIVGGDVSANGCRYDADYTQGLVSVTPWVFDYRVRNAEVALSAINGVVRSEPSGPAVSVVTTDVDGCAEAIIEADAMSHLPVVTEARFQGVVLERQVVANSSYLLLDGYEFELGENSIRGQLVHDDSGEPMADDGHYTAGMRCLQRPVERAVSISLDADGRFAVPLVVAEESDCNELNIMYRGVVITRASLGVMPEVEPHVVSATSEASASVALVSIAAGRTARFVIQVDSAVADAGAALYLELDSDLPMEADWQGATYYSTSSDYFSLSPVAPVATSLLKPNGITVTVSCRGSCVVVDSDAGNAIVAVTNPYSYDYPVDLYAFTEAFNDSSEPANDSRLGGERFSLADAEGASGALETISDVDYFEVAPDGPSMGILEFLDLGFVEAVVVVEDASGRTKGGPYYSGDRIPVLAGDYLRVEAVDDNAAASANSVYYFVPELE